MGIRRALKEMFAGSPKYDEMGKLLPDPGALTIAPADGYQYGDDHVWTGADQSRLVDTLDKLMAKLDAEIAADRKTKTDETPAPLAMSPELREAIKSLDAPGKRRKGPGSP